jgi:hypothetical protein
LPRHSGWRPIFGQTGNSQGHLQNNRIAVGDIFVFFGLFRRAVHVSGKFTWDAKSRPCHALWGWLQIDAIVKVDTCERGRYGWARYHPHFHRRPERRNTLYIACEHLALPGLPQKALPGAGTFLYFSPDLRLTAPGASMVSLWALPPWFFPRHGHWPLTYHKKLNRWQRTKRGCLLKTVGRGQEFVLDMLEYPEAGRWLLALLRTGREGGVGGSQAL